MLLLQAMSGRGLAQAQEGLRFVPRQEINGMNRQHEYAKTTRFRGLKLDIVHMNSRRSTDSSRAIRTEPGVGSQLHDHNDICCCMLRGFDLCMYSYFVMTILNTSRAPRATDFNLQESLRRWSRAFYGFRRRHGHALHLRIL
jgi:hypothetical protein